MQRRNALKGPLVRTCFIRVFHVGSTCVYCVANVFCTCLCTPAQDSNTCVSRVSHVGDLTCSQRVFVWGELKTLAKHTHDVFLEAKYIYKNCVSASEVFGLHSAIMNLVGNLGTMLWRLGLVIWSLGLVISCKSCSPTQFLFEVNCLMRVIAWCVFEVLNSN